MNSYGASLLFVLVFSSFSPAPAQGDPIRWTDPAFNQWSAYNIDVSDGGATLLCGKELGQKALSVYAGGNQTPVHEFDYAPETAEVFVAGAERESLVASLISQDVDPGPGFAMQGSLSVYRGDSGNLLWSFDFPGLNSSRVGGGVGISDDGAVIVAAFPSEADGFIDIRAFQLDGSLIRAGTLPSPNAAMGGFRLSADGGTALIRANAAAIVWDVFGAREEGRVSLYSIFDTMSLSRDGRRVATGYWDGVAGFADVHERDASGQWVPVWHRDLRADTLVSRVALDADGNRLALILQDIEWEFLEVHYYNVNQDKRIFRHKFEAPGTSLQLGGSGLCVDDAGRTIAGSSWGDDADVTPEVFVFDRLGNLITEVDLQGSAIHLSMDAAGDVLAVRAKTVHATSLGGSAELHAIDARPQDLHVLGVPALGGFVELSLDNSGPAADGYVVIASDWVDAPSGQWQVDWSSMLGIVGPLAVPTGGLQQLSALPADPSLTGVRLVMQAALLQSGSVKLTNKVVMRLL